MAYYDTLKFVSLRNEGGLAKGKGEPGLGPLKRECWVKGDMPLLFCFLLGSDFF
jgi:hypothetical protein